MRDWCVYVERFLRNPPTFLAGQILKRAHVVQSIGQFYKDDSHVIDHRQKHLAHVQRLTFLVRCVVQFRDLGQAVNKVSDLGTKVLLDLFDGGIGILDDVVQQAGCYANGIELELRQNVGDLEWVDEVGFAGLPNLSAVFSGREQVGTAKEFLVGARMVLPNLLNYGLETNHALKEKGWHPFERVTTLEF